MAAGDTIFACRFGKTGNTQIDQVSHGRIQAGTVAVYDQGTAIKAGRQGTQITDKRIAVEVYGIQPLLVLTGATHNGAAIAGAVSAKVIPGATSIVNQGAAGSPGPADCLVTRRELTVEIYGIQYKALMDFIGDAAADVVLSSVNASGVAKTVTIKSVYFDEAIPAIEVPDRDAGGKLPTSGIRGRVQWDIYTAFSDVLSGDGDLNLINLIGAPAANWQFGTFGAAGANETITVKNVYFTEFIPALELPEKDAGGRLRPAGVRGIGLWGGSDTFATMIVAA